MFGINVKKVFQEKISDVIIILLTIHLIAAIFSFIINRILPYFRSYGTVKKNHSTGNISEMMNHSLSGLNVTCDKEEHSVLPCIEINGEFGDEDLASVDFVQLSDKYFNQSYRNNISIDDLTHQIETASYLKSLLQKKARSGQCSSEVQTDLTFRPNINMNYYSCIDTMSYNFVTGLALSSSISTDSFLSANSGHENLQVESSHAPVIRNFGICDILKQENKTVYSRKNNGKGFGSFLKTDKESVVKQNVPGLVCRAVPCGNEKQISQENKILEIAITEFEKELKPIKDQIKILKEYIHDFDKNDEDTGKCSSNSMLSDCSYLGCGDVTQSQCFSSTLSSFGSSDLNSYISSHHTIFERAHDSSQAKMKRDSKLESTYSNKDYSQHPINVNKRTQLRKEVINFTGINDSLNFRESQSPVYKPRKKRSPLADMYVKLSQCTSQLSAIPKPRKQRVKYEDAKTVTCRINLNLNLGDNAFVTQAPKTYPIKDRMMDPMFSDPEDVIGKCLEFSALKNPK